MSWNVNLTGAPAKVADALETVNAGLSGQSKDEWEAARPHLKALVAANFVDEQYKKTYSATPDILVSLVASGSASTQDGKPVLGSCSVKLETIYTNLV